MDLNPMGMIGGLLGGIGGGGKELTDLIDIGSKALGASDVMGGGKAQKAQSSQSAATANVVGEFKLDFGQMFQGLSDAMATMFHPSANQQQAVQGYAKPAAANTQNNFQTSEFDEALSALKTIKDNFGLFDRGNGSSQVEQRMKDDPNLPAWLKDAMGPDKKISLSTLEALADDETAPEGIRKAAQYITSNPDLMSSLDRAGNLGVEDGQFSRGNLEVMINQLEKDKAAGGVKAAKQAQSNATPPSSQSPGSQNTGSSQSKPPASQSGVAPSPSPQGNQSLDSKVATMSDGLDAMQDKLAALIQKQESGATLSAQEKTDLALLPNKLQRAAHKLSEMSNLLSNLMAAFHQMSMNAIGHIR